MPLLAAFALTLGTAAAQAPAPAGPGLSDGRAPGTPEEVAARQSQRLTRALGLNADQTAKVKQILLARGQEMQGLRGQPRDAANRGQRREQLQANRAKYEAQFQAVLTPDQFAKFTALEADRRPRGGRGPEGGDGKMKMKNGRIKIKQADR